MKGKFIVIEGLDGSGSTTQAGLLSDFLKLNGIAAISTKEPTDNVVGGLIRGALTGVYKLPSVSIQFLFSADRGHHINRLIQPKLEEGTWVVCDRYLWSSIAFGSIDIDKNWLYTMQKHFVKPDLTIFLQVSPETCVKRIKKDRYNVELFEEEEKLKKVWTTYTWLAKKHPKDIKIIDGNQSEKEVFQDIVKLVRTMMTEYF